MKTVSKCMILLWDIVGSVLSGNYLKYYIVYGEILIILSYLHYLDMNICSV